MSKRPQPWSRSSNWKKSREHCCWNKLTAGGRRALQGLENTCGNAVLGVRRVLG